MKKFFFSLLFVISSLFCVANAQTEYEFDCPLLSVGEEAEAQTGGRYKPASNLPGQYFRALVVFVYFGEGGQLPSWSDEFIDSEPVDPGNEYRDMNVSDYWKEMAMGNFDFIGDVYYELVELPSASYYQQNNKDFSDCNRDVLEEIDPNVDFSLYDNWKLVSGQFVFSPGNSDGLVDMVYIIYCSPNDTTKNWFGGGYGNFSGISKLGFSGDFITNDQNQVGQTIKVNGGLGSNGSGLTIRSGYSGHYSVMGICNHEFGHYLFGYDHISYGGIMGGGTYALSGWESERLGYIAYTTVYQDNFTKTMTDFITTGDILRVPIPLSNPNSPNYFLVENHQRLSHYDQITRGGSLNGQWTFETTVGTGIYITLNHYANGFESLVVYPKFGDGNFEWEVTDTMFNSIINGCDLPGFTRTSVNRNIGLPDRMITTPWYRCDLSSYTEAMWYDKDPLTLEWTPTRDRIGDDTDPFSLSNNNLFSPWSNPSSYSSLTGGVTNYSVWLYNQFGNSISIQVKTTESSSLSLPPSKPHLGWDPRDLGRPYELGWIYLAWGADFWDGDPIEPDYEWSELQRKIGSGSWVTLYSGPNRVWSDGSITYDPNGSTPVYFRVRVRDTQDLWSLWSDVYSTNMMNQIQQKYNAGMKSKDAPFAYSLHQNFPNPFNPSTQITYTIISNGFVSLKIYDVLGNEVADLVNEKQSSGTYSIEFNAGSLPSGIYFYTLSSGSYTSTKKLILLK